ncbi:FAD-dependent oxidoreductase [Planctomicrobium sp.]|nr:FAD-dependent oxidoreductase [Planctomicrobium sp.]MDB4733093.1 FAD-dependent oxidoreductase [Planctomicrobium sp.]
MTSVDSHTNLSASRVAVIGAGISGLACAQALKEQGAKVTVYDKGRGAGGRMSTRRTAERFEFDHGCQYFSATEDRFQKHVKLWQQLGIVELWREPIGILGQGKFTETKEEVERFVGVSTMSAICNHLAGQLDVHFNTEVNSLTRFEMRWELAANENSLGEYDAVIVSTPPQQAFQLVGDSSVISEGIVEFEMLPCWTVMVAFTEPTGLKFGGAKVIDSSLKWVSNNSSKPNRKESPEQWVLQASAAWSEANIDADRDEVKSQLLEAFFTATGLAPQKSQYSQAHRWRYAVPTTSANQRFYCDESQFLGLCGDWCGQPQVQGAFLSGKDLAEHLIKAFATC